MHFLEKGISSKNGIGIRNKTHKFNCVPHFEKFNSEAMYQKIKRYYKEIIEYFSEYIEIRNIFLLRSLCAIELALEIQTRK